MTVYQTFTLPRLGEWLSPERDWPRSKPESSAWARVREILVAPASLAWASYSSLGEIDRSCHCLSYNSHISIPKQQSKIVHTFITNVQFMQYQTNIKLARKSFKTPKL